VLSFRLISVTTAPQRSSSSAFEAKPWFWAVIETRPSSVF
jgi:hypothetical protein